MVFQLTFNYNILLHLFCFARTQREITCEYLSLQRRALSSFLFTSLSLQLLPLSSLPPDLIVFFPDSLSLFPFLSSNPDSHQSQSKENPLKLASLFFNTSYSFFCTISALSSPLLSIQGLWVSFCAFVSLFVQKRLALYKWKGSHAIFKGVAARI